MVTRVGMAKIRLVTKETMDEYYKEKIEIDSETIDAYNKLFSLNLQSKDAKFKESVGDDLESFFMDLQNGLLPKRESRTFFLPKIMSSERKMIEERNHDVLMNYFSSIKHEEIHSKTLDFLDESDVWQWLKEFRKIKTQAIETADVSKVELEMSESNSKYILCYCARKSIIVCKKKIRKRKIH